VSHETNCDQAYRQLFSYLDRELNDEEMLHVRQHLDDCPPCAVCFEFEGAVVRYVRERAPRERCPGTVAKRILTAFRARVAVKSGRPDDRV
jgi:mycothiol system anti-sigma-R factor